MPESMQSAERGEKAEAAIENLGEAMDNIQSAIDMLEAASE